MSTRRFALFGALAGAAAAALVAAGSRIYNERTLDRRASVEGLDSPEVAAGFARVASMPQMRLLHRLAISRALALVGGASAGGHAVDIGCGPGHLAVQIANMAPNLQVTGVDLSNALLDEANARVLQAGLAHRVDFRTGDAASLPFDDASVDLVVSTLSLHHWSDPALVLDEVTRVLRPGGAFLVFDLRRDMFPPFYVLIWFASHYVVPRALRHVGEPMGSRNAAYTPGEAAALAQASRLTGWRVAAGTFWLTIEGTTSR